MKTHHYRVVGAVVAALAAASAQALSPTTTAAIASDHSLVIAGSSSARDAFESLLRDSLCVAGTFNVFQANSTGSPDLRAYSCTLVSTSIVNANLQGDDVVYYYR